MYAIICLNFKNVHYLLCSNDKFRAIILFRPRNQFHPMPGTRSSFNIRDLLDVDRVPPIPGSPRIEFRRNCSKFRNQKEFFPISELEAVPEIPESEGISGNSRAFRAIPSPLNSQQFRGWNWFPNVQHREIGCIL